MSEIKEAAKPRDINNKEALKRKLNKIKLNFDWIERLDVITDSGVEFDDKVIVDDDINREQLFYKQAQAAIIEAIPRLKAAGVKIKKPNDYVAEMIKSESHMERVKKAHMEREAILDKIEKAKKARKDRKMAKIVQTQVKLAKREERKQFDQKIAKFKKGVDKNLDFLEDNKKPVTKSAKNSSKIKKQTKKAAYKQQRFGMGGQKKRKKYNTAESSADVSSFNKRRYSGNKSKGVKGMKGGRMAGKTTRKGKAGKSKNRPGKERRKAMKMKSKK